MKNKGKVFTTLLLLLTVLMSGLMFPLISNLGIYTAGNQNLLVSMLASSLDAVALNRAKMINPDYSWLTLTEETTPEIENAVKEEAFSHSDPNEAQLSEDSNLAWVIDFNGKPYSHNWKDSYDETEGLVDYTITAQNGKITTSGATIPDEQASRLFNVINKALVNPNLVPENRTQGNEYGYTLSLPDGFSIRFYVPGTLEKNGGIIARMARSLNNRAYGFAIVCGAVVMTIFVLFYRKEAEMNSRMMKQFTKMKALFAWMILLGSIAGSAFLSILTSTLCSTGEMQVFLKTIGFNPVVATLFTILSTVLVWALFYYLVALLVLYLKYIFTGGVGRYLKEDTLMAGLIKRMETAITKAATSQTQKLLIHRLVPTFLAIAAFVCVSVLLATSLFGLPGLVVMTTFDVICIAILLWRIVSLMEKGYQKVLESAQQLAQGNFSEIGGGYAGFFQPLYDSLLEIRSSYQKALDDGLSSQITKTQLISNVSHDLKTPVTGIQSYAELIQLTDDPAQIKSYGARLENYAMRLSRLIEDLFDVAKASSGDIQLSPVQIDLAELLMQVQIEWEDELNRKNLQVVMDVPSSAPVMLDPDKTMRIIDNLLSNVRKYSLESSRVFVTLQKIPNQYVLVIKNTSKTPLDFSPDEIVERFVRGDKSRHEAGSGLGLAIVKSFMEIQQGSFNVEIDGDLFKAILVFQAPEEDKPALPETEKPEDEFLEDEENNSVQSSQ